jgi:hypothetical protein
MGGKDDEGAKEGMQPRESYINERLDLCWLLGTSVQKLVVCTSLIFLFFYFPLVKYIELLGEGRTDLPVFSGHVRKMPREPGTNAVHCLVRKARTRAGNRKIQDDADPITLLGRTCLTHPLLNTL